MFQFPMVSMPVRRQACVCSFERKNKHAAFPLCWVCLFSLQRRRSTFFAQVIRIERHHHLLVSRRHHHQHHHHQVESFPQTVTISMGMWRRSSLVGMLYSDCDWQDWWDVHAYVQKQIPGSWLLCGGAITADGGFRPWGSIWEGYEPFKNSCFVVMRDESDVKNTGAASFDRYLSVRR